MNDVDYHKINPSFLLKFIGAKNLKKTIIAELNKKGLTDKEIYLLQKLAGISKD